MVAPGSDHGPPPNRPRSRLLFDSHGRGRRVVGRVRVGRAAGYHRRGGDLPRAPAVAVTCAVTVAPDASDAYVHVTVAAETVQPAGAARTENEPFSVSVAVAFVVDGPRFETLRSNANGLRCLTEDAEATRATARSAVGGGARYPAGSRDRCCSPRSRHPATRCRRRRRRRARAGCSDSRMGSSASSSEPSVPPGPWR